MCSFSEYLLLCLSIVTNKILGHIVPNNVFGSSATAPQKKYYLGTKHPNNYLLKFFFKSKIKTIQRCIFKSNI